MITDIRIGSSCTGICPMREIFICRVLTLRVPKAPTRVCSKQTGLVPRYRRGDTYPTYVMKRYIISQLRLFFLGSPAMLTCLSVSPLTPSHPFPPHPPPPPLPLLLSSPPSSLPLPLPSPSSSTLPLHHVRPLSPPPPPHRRYAAGF